MTIQVRELAITTLCYSLARQVDGKIIHYNFRFPGEIVPKEGFTERARKHLEGLLEDTIEVVKHSNDGVLQVTDLTQYLSMDMRNRLLKKYDQTIVQYDIPYYPFDMGTRLGRFKDRAARFVTSLYWKLKGMFSTRSAMSRVRMHFSIPGRSFIDRLEEKLYRLSDSLYYRMITPVTYFAARGLESEEAALVRHIESKMAVYRESIIGSLSPPISVKLADVIGDGQQRVVVICYVALKGDVGSLIQELVRTKQFDILRQMDVIREGDSGVWRSSMPETPIIENVDILLESDIALEAKLKEDNERETS